MVAERPMRSINDQLVGHFGTGHNVPMGHNAPILPIVILMAILAVLAILAAPLANSVPKPTIHKLYFVNCFTWHTSYVPLTSSTTRELVSNTSLVALPISGGV